VYLIEFVHTHPKSVRVFGSRREEVGQCRPDSRFWLWPLCMVPRRCPARTTLRRRFLLVLVNFQDTEDIRLDQPLSVVYDRPWGTTVSSTLSYYWTHASCAQTPAEKLQRRTERSMMPSDKSMMSSFGYDFYFFL
jgi:hypothetical protein